MNTRLAQGSQYRSTLEAPSQSYTTSSEGIDPQVQHGDTFANFFIISFLTSSVVWGEDTIFCKTSSISLGIFSSLIVPLSGLMRSVLINYPFKSSKLLKYDGIVNNPVINIEPSSNHD